MSWFYIIISGIILEKYVFNWKFDIKYWFEIKIFLNIFLMIKYVLNRKGGIECLDG